MESVGYIVLYFVAAIAIVLFSILAVTSRRILRSATYLLFVLISTAVFYFQLDYQFLGAVQIAVYAGGIMVLFVFSILLTSRPADKAPLLASHRRILGIVLAVAGAGALLYAICGLPQLIGDGSSAGALISDVQSVDMNTIGSALMGTEKFQYLLPFEAISVLLLACIIGGVVIARKR